MPEVVVALGEVKRVVVRLRFENDGRRQHSQFEYATEWLAAPDRFALAPGLPLCEGSHFSTGREDRRSALPGCFADAAPDSWGRGLMAKVLGGGLSEFDYLANCGDSILNLCLSKNKIYCPRNSPYATAQSSTIPSTPRS